VKQASGEEEDLFFDCNDAEAIAYKAGLQFELSKYILLHCAKVELSLIDLSTGTLFLTDD
jgi:hypothetical protein